jgi:hypothetical protein
LVLSPKALSIRTPIHHGIASVGDILNVEATLGGGIHARDVVGDLGWGILRGLFEDNLTLDTRLSTKNSN